MMGASAMTIAQTVARPERKQLASLIPRILIVGNLQSETNIVRESAAGWQWRVASADIRTDGKAAGPFPSCIFDNGSLSLDACGLRFPTPHSDSAIATAPLR